MRVLVIVHNYIPECRGGAEIMMHELCKSLVARNHEVNVCVPSTESDGLVMSIDGVIIRTGLEARRLISEPSADVVMSHLTEDTRAFSISQRIGAKFVRVIHNNNAKTRLDMVMKSDLNVFNTNWLMDYFGVDGMVVHPPVFSEKHKTNSGSKITLVNLIPDKGVNLFYELAFRMKGHKFLGVVGGYGRQQKVKVKNVEIQPNTQNMRDDVWAKTRILLMPSNYESYGMVGVEAMASGIPVIAHPTDGLKESLSYAGVFVDRNDVDGWINAIKEVESNYQHYSDLALKRSSEISPDKELSLFVNAIESMVKNAH